MEIMNYRLQVIGASKIGRSWEMTIPKTGQFVGIITERFGKPFKVWFNANATRGSLRKFQTMDDAVAFIHNRRIQRGWPTA